MERFFLLNKKITVKKNRMKSLHSLHNIPTFFTVIFYGYLSNFKNRKMSQWECLTAHYANVRDHLLLIKERLCSSTNQRINRLSREITRQCKKSKYFALKLKKILYFPIKKYTFKTKSFNKNKKHQQDYKNIKRISCTKRMNCTNREHGNQIFLILIGAFRCS